MATIPTDNDVLFGRGGRIASHPGNQRLRAMVREQKQKLKFLQDNNEMARDIVDRIHESGGRFLIPDKTAKKSNGGMETWICVDTEKAVEKVKHRLREKEKGGGGDEGRHSLPSSSPADSAVPSNNGLQSMGAAMPNGSPLGEPLGPPGGQIFIGHTSLSGGIDEGLVQNHVGPLSSPILPPVDPVTAFQNNALQSTEIGASILPSASVSPPGTIDLQGSNVYLHGGNQASQQEEVPVGSAYQEDNGIPSLCRISVERGGIEKPHIDATFKPLAGEQTSNDGARSVLELSNLDEHLDSFLRDFSTQHDHDQPVLQKQEVHTYESVQELTMQEWIIRSKPKMRDQTAPVGGLPGLITREYILSAIPIALRLTECLMEAEKDEVSGHEGNPIPLASIASSNVLIRAKKNPPAESCDGVEANEAIEYVWVMSNLGDDPATGSVTHRLAALGCVLYELFSAKFHPEEEGLPKPDAYPNTMLVNSINLNNELEGYRPRKRSQQQPSPLGDNVSGRILALESFGVPPPLCAVVGNLLDCSNGDFRGDDAYTSLGDLCMDLQLMLDDPSRFLDGIETTPLPSLSICDKLYGRKEDVAKLEMSYQQHINGGCKGVLISGGAGIGKSKLAVHVIQKLTKKEKGYFLSAKFDQNKEFTMPLAVVGAVFNSLCDYFAQDATPDQLARVEEMLELALGKQASLLADIVPSLSKLMPSCVQLSPSSSCVDSALSVRFQFGELLRVLAIHSRSISFVWDDIQWADSASLKLIEHLLVSNIAGGVFHTFCYRDNEAGKNDLLDAWLASIRMMSLDSIALDNMTADGVNHLVADALHLSPRLTRPLASVLHHKSHGNPFFLRQLMVSLAEQNLIYVNLHPPRWAWRLNEIMDQKISDDVLALLIEEMQKLPPEVQLAMKVASCLGSFAKTPVLSILSNDIGIDLVDALQQASKRGYMDCDGGGTTYTFSFAHDKIQQASAELMTERERREKHMQLGLALCSCTMGNATQGDDLFFLAVNLMNRGGPDVIHDTSQRNIIAELNLRAGRRSIVLSDNHTASHLFKQGISFLGENHWATNYRLSIDLYDAAAEASCVLDKSVEVEHFSEALFAHAKTSDDQLNCLYCVVKSLRHAGQLKDMIESTFKILIQLGEQLPRPMGETTLMNDIQTMNDTLQVTTDADILNMREIADRKMFILLKLYAILVNALHLAKPSLVGAVSVRMVALTMNFGLTAISPLAFAFYGELLVSLGNLGDGCRFGRLALKLLEKKSSQIYKSEVLCAVYQHILWASEPLQSIAEAHMIGYKSGQQSGDVFYSHLNYLQSILANQIAGRHLDSVQEDVHEFMRMMPPHQNNRPFVVNAALLNSTIRVLRDGMQTLEYRDSSIPMEREIVANPTFANNKIAMLGYRMHQLSRAFFFCQLDVIVPDIVNIWGEICDQKHFLRAVLVVGAFYEGLASFHLARRREGEKAKWIAQGDLVLAKMKEWSAHSSWNWGGFAFLLSAEKMHTVGNYEEAAPLYECAIRALRENRFTHGEAISSDLAANFFYERGLHEKAFDLFMHSMKCYEAWGALAVAKRVESDIASRYGPGSAKQRQTGATLDVIFALSEGSSKKRGVDHSSGSLGAVR